MTETVEGSILYRLHRSLGRGVADFGGFWLFTWETLVAFIFGGRTWNRWWRIGPQFYRVGSTSVPVLILTGAFIGAVLSLESYFGFAAIGQQNRLGGVINLSIVKQIGPVLAAVMLAGRVGCSLTAELGSMRVTEQLDAMRVMAADPVRVLVVPRVLACVVMIPILVVVSNAFGILGGWFVSTRVYDANPAQYWEFTQSFLSWFDVANGLIKSVFFGLAIGLIACYKGFTCRPGATGVGAATTASFVTSFIAIIILNLVLAKVLNDIDAIRLGGEMRKIL
ncbi:MAG: ABC transporter permease [Phycisphaeraceae bacterium]|nr:MAG: ABC transporter permease [Phycisphaeraceae bacterium]